MMTVILNNDTEHEFNISEFQYDYLKHDCIIRNHDIDSWNQGVSSYIASMKETTITSIELRSDGESIRTYANINGKIESFLETFQLYGMGPMIAFEVGIKLN